MARNQSLLTIILLFTTHILFAQETSCDNSIDDDNDGFTDCFDSDCNQQAGQCSDFFFGNDLVCTDVTDNPTFAMRLQWGSGNRTAQSSTTPAIGDIDNDGIPEVIVTNRESRELYILDGATGATEGVVNLGFTVNRTAAIAKVDNSNTDCGWIFVQGDTDRRIRAYDCNLVQQWSVNASNSDSPGLLSLADFDGDGNVELYHRNEIRNAFTGALIATGGGDWNTESSEGSSAADILPDSFCGDCDGLELADGNIVWSVNIGTGTLTPQANMNDLLAVHPDLQSIPASEREFTHKFRASWNQQNSYISLADYNQNGTIDVVTSGALGDNPTDPTTIFFWDVLTGTVDFYQDSTNNFQNGTGRINIGDTDGDGQLNATYVSNQILYSLDENLDPIWTLGIKEGSSGFTGCTLFDFNGDGAVETVYRGEDFLFIIDGAADDANRISNTVVCVSRTYEDYPIVADVDADGSSEICVTCSFDDNQPFNPYSNSINGHIRIYESDGEQWLPSRPVWNQHGFFNTHINDDLTVPIDQQSHITPFNDVNCEGEPVSFQPLNVFLNQAAILDATGCPNAVFPDLDLVDGSIQFTPPACPQNEFDVSFQVANTGDTELNGVLPVSFYNGDPRLSTSTYLSTDFYVLQGLDVGETAIVNVRAEGPGPSFELFVSVNDLGATPPVTNFIGSIPECTVGADLGSVFVDVTPFSISAVKISDNQKCIETLPDNGSARAFFDGTLPNTEVLVWEEGFDDLANGTTVDNGETAWSRTIPPGGDFVQVAALASDNAFWFRDTDGEAVWTSEEIDISAFSFANLSMTMISSSNLESDNYLRAFYSVDGGAETLFTNGDQSGNFFTVLPTAQVSGSTVRIIVRQFSDQDNEQHYIDDIEVNGVVEEQTGQFTSGFTFYWFLNNNFSNPAFEGAEYVNMSEGTYSVVGVYDFSQCTSDTLFNAVTIDLVPAETPVVTITGFENNSDCGFPTGEISAAVVQGGDLITEGFQFTWSDANVLSETIAVGPTVTNLAGGSYAVIATNTATGCVSEPVVQAIEAPSPGFHGFTISYSKR